MLPWAVLREKLGGRSVLTRAVGLMKEKRMLAAAASPTDDRRHEYCDDQPGTCVKLPILYFVPSRWPMQVVFTFFLQVTPAPLLRDSIYASPLPHTCAAQKLETKAKPDEVAKSLRRDQMATLGNTRLSTGSCGCERSTAALPTTQWFPFLPSRHFNRP
jgi:hypothetical protein